MREAEEYDNTDPYVAYSIATSSSRPQTSPLSFCTSPQPSFVCANTFPPSVGWWAPLRLPQNILPSDIVSNK